MGSDCKVGEGGRGSSGPGEVVRPGNTEGIRGTCHHDIDGVGREGATEGFREVFGRVVGIDNKRNRIGDKGWTQPDFLREFQEANECKGPGEWCWAWQARRWRGRATD